MSPTTWGWLVLAFPLAGLLVISLGWRWLPGRSAGWIGTAAIFAAFGCAVGALLSLEGRSGEEAKIVTSTAYNYASTVGVDARLTILVDPLSVFMILIVSGVSALIHLYSVAYIWEDAGYRRFFAYLNYFVFSMLLLVLAGNFLILIIGWAFVGAASYLLISFWYRRQTATRAGIKAFVMNVIGDVGLVLGTFFIFKHTGTLDFLATFDRTPDVFSTNQGDLVAGLHPAPRRRVREVRPGPAPHLAARCDGGPDAGVRPHPRGDDGHRRRLPDRAHAPAVRAGPGGRRRGRDGGLRHAVHRRDHRADADRHQTGHRLLDDVADRLHDHGRLASAYSAGMFHLLTHAFFKALLFMAAGSIIGAMGGEQSLDRMGGFRSALPFTFGCFLAGGLALAAFPAFSGFFSKDDDPRAHRRARAAGTGSSTCSATSARS